MTIQIDGWGLYPNESKAALIAELMKHPVELAQAAMEGEIDVEVTFSPVPDDCARLRWFGRMLIKALRKAEAKDAADHFEHWMSGKGNEGAPALTPEILRQTYCFQGLMEDFRELCCGPGAAESGEASCSEFRFNWKLHVLLGEYKVKWSLSARGADGCCDATFTVEDRYDFRIGESATFQHGQKETIAGKELMVWATFSVPDEVLTKLKACKIGEGDDAHFPADFDRAVTWSERVCCEEEGGEKPGGEKPGGEKPGGHGAEDEEDQ